MFGQGLAFTVGQPSAHTQCPSAPPRAPWQHTEAAPSLVVGGGDGGGISSHSCVSQSLVGFHPHQSLESPIQDAGAMMDIDDKSFLVSLTETISHLRSDPSHPLSQSDLHPSDVIALPTSLPSSTRKHTKTAVIVVDTNYWVSHASFCSKLLAHLPSDTPIGVPKVVITELDGLKGASINHQSDQYNLNMLARHSGDLIYRAFLEKKVNIIGQRDGETMLKQDELRTRHTAVSHLRITNDDLILDYARYCLSVHAPRVVLLSNDKNLCTKAMIESITTFSHFMGTPESFLRLVLDEVTSHATGPVPTSSPYRTQNLSHHRPSTSSTSTTSSSISPFSPRYRNDSMHSGGSDNITAPIYRATVPNLDVLDSVRPQSYPPDASSSASAYCVLKPGERPHRGSESPRTHVAPGPRRAPAYTSGRERRASVTSSSSANGNASSVRSARGTRTGKRKGVAEGGDLDWDDDMSRKRVLDVGEGGLVDVQMLSTRARKARLLDRQLTRPNPRVVTSSSQPLTFPPPLLNDADTMMLDADLPTPPNRILAPYSSQHQQHQQDATASTTQEILAMFVPSLKPSLEALLRDRGIPFNRALDSDQASVRPRGSNAGCRPSAPPPASEEMYLLAVLERHHAYLTTRGCLKAPDFLGTRLPTLRGVMAEMVRARERGRGGVTCGDLAQFLRSTRELWGVCRAAGFEGDFRKANALVEKWEGWLRV
ncbi:PIN domain-containing protein [Chytriomyces sp. MP71]|nr:PIN domain-containing protein [Chytriomyces sp. MP71]